MYETEAYILWDSVRAAVNERIGLAILAQSTRADLNRLKFKMYGMFFAKIMHGHICDCGDEVKHSNRVVNKVAFSILNSRGGGNRIPYNVEFGLQQQAPTCRACGKK